MRSLRSALVEQQLAGATLVLGGARSGKSRYAESLVLRSGLQPVYLATGEPLDDEISVRIAEHRRRRDERWRTVEEPLALAETLERESRRNRCVLVDCLTFWLANLLTAERDIAAAISRLAECIPDLPGPLVLVANEVGLGIVPDHPLGRDFRDHAGLLNQRIAALAETVRFVVAGIPIQIKPNQ
jgi:adenosylcobinamide kinase / adenosylcobinamide-phosphate guanylyltransferase